MHWSIVHTLLPSAQPKDTGIRIQITNKVIAIKHRHGCEILNGFANCVHGYFPFVTEQTGQVGQFADVVVVANEFAGVVVEQIGHVGQFADVTVGQFTGACVGDVVGTVKFRVQASFLLLPPSYICVDVCVHVVDRFAFIFFPFLLARFTRRFSRFR